MEGDDEDAERTVFLLLDHGADVNTRCENGSYSGTTPLIEFLWLRRQSLRVFHAMIERGADVNAKDSHGRSPLIHVLLEDPAIRVDEREISRVREIVRLLITKGARPDVVDRFGNTPASLLRERPKALQEAVSRLLVSSNGRKH